MLRYVTAFMLLLVPTLAVAQAQPQLMCGPADKVLNSLKNKGFKIGGVGDLTIPSEKDSRIQVLIVYNIETRSMKTLALGEKDGTAMVCLLNEVENFNTKTQ